MIVDPIDFEDDDKLRSAQIRELILRQTGCASTPAEEVIAPHAGIPRTLLRYWHDARALPDDVRACLESWDRLADEGFTFQMFDDERATAYIADVYGERESKAFSRCVHQRRDDQGLVRQALIPTLPDIHDRLIECVAGLGRAWNLRRGHAVILHVALVRGAAPRWMSSM